MTLKILALLLGSCTPLCAQKSMSLKECEQVFRSNNLQLLAEQYNISQADADIIQAKFGTYQKFLLQEMHIILMIKNLLMCSTLKM